MTAKGIFCLEGIWDNDLRKRSTVEPILLLLKQRLGIPYIHRDCATVHEFEFYLSKFIQATYRKYPILYLAFHGKEGSIMFNGRESYSLDEMSDSLKGKCKKTVIIIGSCSTMDIRKQHLKSFLSNTGALAVCGYRNDVDWMRSTAFELLLLSELQHNIFDGRGIKSIAERSNRLAKSFRLPDSDKNIDFKMVSIADSC